MSPKLSSVVDDTNEANNVALFANNVDSGETANVMISSSKGGGSGYHYPNEECNGMLRIWDGPLREVPVCNDLNWYVIRS